MFNRMKLDNSDEYVTIGDVAIAYDQMVYFRDFDMYSAKIEFEDGTVKWVPRSYVSAL